jgi:hypothetical protein
VERDPRPHEEDVNPDDAQGLSRPAGEFVGEKAPDIDDSGELGSDRRGQTQAQPGA